jgi:5-methylcytosine-specific restriction endonuclease McrA
MITKHEIIKMSDDDLLRRLSELLAKSRSVEAELIAHIAEVDRRRLYARTSSSMFKYAVEILHLSEAEAYLRIEVARASRKHPILLEMLADGRLHLSGIAVLSPILTEGNRETVLFRAVHKSKREIKELVAELAPKPDVPDSIRKLPERPEQKEVTTAPGIELRPNGVGARAETPPASDPTPPPAKSAETEPLSPSRFKVVFTASAELRGKLERLQALMRSSGNESDLASVIDAAVTEKLEKLEAKRYGTTKNSRKSLEETDTTPTSQYIPAPVRRVVYARDEGQCTHKGPDGRRCTETTQLEFHHIHPYGLGGDHSPSNICLKCRAHNLYQAELDYGKDVMDRYRPSEQVSEPAAIYASNFT